MVEGKGFKHRVVQYLGHLRFAGVRITANQGRIRNPGATARIQAEILDATRDGTAAIGRLDRFGIGVKTGPCP